MVLNDAGNAMNQWMVGARPNEASWRISITGRKIFRPYTGYARVILFVDLEIAVANGI